MGNATSKRIPALDVQCGNTIRTLSMDAVEAAQAGHSGAPMGLAAAGYLLWARVLKHNPLDYAWPDRVSCSPAGTPRPCYIACCISAATICH